MRYEVDQFTEGDEAFAICGGWRSQEDFSAAFIRPILIVKVFGIGSVKWLGQTKIWDSFSETHVGSLRILYCRLGLQESQHIEGNVCKVDVLQVCVYFAQRADLAPSHNDKPKVAGFV